MENGKRARRAPKFVPDTRTLTGRSGEPPTWAVATIVGIIILIGLIFSIEQFSRGAISDHVPYGHSDWFWVGLIFLPLPALIIVVAISKLVEMRKAAAWVQTTGRILRSDIAVKHHRFEGEAETVENVPAVEYEFAIGERKVHGSRIGIGDDTGGANTEQTLARYPLGATVTVFYDADDPRNCVLERGGPSGITTAGCIGALAEIALIGGALYWVVVHGADFVAARFPNAEANLALFTGGFGLALSWFFLAFRRYSKQAAQWPTARAKIVRSEVESYRSTSDGSTTTMHRPAVEYTYVVRGHDYRSNQIMLGVTAGGSQGSAEKVVARYPAGAEVEVHYDPANPGTAALENPTGAAWIIAAIALFCFGMSVYALGVFR